MQVSDKITLRTISLDDQQELYQLMRRIYLPVYKHLWEDSGQSYLEDMYSYEQLKKDLREPDVLYCFVLYQSEVVGIIRLLENEPNSYFKNKKASKLQRIYLDGSVRGKGVGKMLMNWMQERVRQSGSAIFWLEVMDSQQKAIGFYESLGFQIFNTFKFDSDVMYEDLAGMYQMWKTA